MVRKAKTLTTIDELRLSLSTEEYLLTNYASLERIVWEGRYAAYLFRRDPDTIKSQNVAVVDLIRALDNGGFIRHDFTSGSFCINLLFRIIYPGFDQNLPYRFDSLCRVSCETSEDGSVNRLDFALGNERYENFQVPTAQLLTSVKFALKSRLAEGEYRVIAYRFGFVDGETHSSEKAAKHLGVTEDFIKTVEANALKRLKETFPLSNHHK